MRKGFFITVEGIDGIGKSTQLKLLLKALESRHALYFTKEPGDAQFGSNVGAGVRDIIFRSPGTKNLAPGVADLLFLADHVQNVHDVLKALQRGEIVVSDRYADSQFAYASHPSKQAPAWANRYFQEQYGLIPDRTLLLKARGPAMDGPIGREDIGWALQRANARRGAEAGKQDGKAWNDLRAQQVIQEAYCAELDRKLRTAVIDVYEKDTAEEIHSKILDQINSDLAFTQQNGRILLPPVAKAA